MNSRAKEYFFNCFGSMVSVNGSSVCAEAKVYVAVGRLCFARLPASQRGTLSPSAGGISALRVGYFCIVSVSVSSAAPRRRCTGRSAGFASLACLLLRGTLSPSGHPLPG